MPQSPDDVPPAPGRREALLGDDSTVEVHEAGHAIAAMAMLYQVTQVGIHVFEGRPIGVTMYRPTFEAALTPLDAARREADVLMAGCAAELHAKPTVSDAGGLIDRADARDRFLGAGCDEAAAGKEVAMAQERASRLVAEHWSAIKGLADVVRERGVVPGDEAARLARRFGFRVRRH